jgi:hypothetical protein
MAHQVIMLYADDALGRIDHYISEAFDYDDDWSGTLICGLYDIVLVW